MELITAASILSGIIKKSNNVAADIVRWSVDHDGIRMSAIDQAHVTVADMFLHNTSFAQYKLPTPVEFAFTLDTVNQIMGRSITGDLVSLTLPKQDVFRITFVSATRTLEYDVRINDDTSEGMIIPPVDNYIALDEKLFVEACKNIAIAGEEVDIVYQNHELVFKTKSLLSGVHTFPAQQLRIRGEAPPDGTKTTISVPLTLKTIAAPRIADIVLLHLEKDQPFRMKYEIGQGYLQFVIVPKVFDEDD